MRIFYVIRSVWMFQTRNGLHWWLTGFNVGEFSDNRELTMEVAIGFPNVQCIWMHIGMHKWVKARESAYTRKHSYADSIVC